MKNHARILLITLIATGFYACSGNGKNTSADSVSTAATTKQPIDTADARLAKNLSIFCNTQIEAAKLAGTKASNKNVQTFARQNQELYSGLSNHLNQIAESYAIKLPAEPSSTAQKNLQDLKEVKGSSFDHAYLLRVLKDHNAMIREYNAAKNIQCVPLKIFVGSNQAAIIKQAYTISDLKDKTP
jgi:predicted outer membrane protein